MARKALLCGINNYKSVSDLQGCLNDVDDMKHLLEKEFGFEPRDIEVLKDDQVRRKQLKDKWTWLASKAAPGDHLVFHFSGHGSFIKDLDNDEDDGADEVFCLWDIDAEFSNPRTYLVDDELAQWIKMVPTGVELTVITDSCHSGTATRAILLRKDGGEVRALVDSAVEHARATRALAAPGAAPAPVLVRFLEPPADKRPSPRGIRALRAKRDARPQSYLHLAACNDQQTAADAQMDGGAHGAFTYHLCRAIRANAGADSRQLVGLVARELSASGFSQTPQSSGPVRPAPIFGGQTHPNVTPVQPGPVAPETPGTMDGSATQPQIGALLEAQRDLARAQASLAQAMRYTPMRDAIGAGNDVLVCIHGIGPHHWHFSDQWWEVLKKHVGSFFGDCIFDQTRFEVYWADIVNDIPRAMAPRDPGVAREMDQARQELQAEVAQRQIEREGALSRGGWFQPDDFLRYMYDSNIRQQVLQRFRNIFDSPKLAGKRIHILSHSWGTVVGYEGLMEFTTTPNVANFFTIGAALSFWAVRSRLGLRNVRPAGVAKWWNINNKGDFVGGALSPHFPIDQEFLNLKPMECSTWKLGCCHSAYFDPENTIVQHDIIAAHILGSGPRAIGGATPPLGGGGGGPAGPDGPVIIGPSTGPRAPDSSAQVRQAVDFARGTVDRLLAAPRTIPRGNSAGLLIAEGDSWFDYPLHDVLSRLEDNHGYDVRSVAHRGDAVEGMAYDGQFRDLRRLIEKLVQGHEPVPKAVLLSGGGNDVAGPEFAMLLNHINSPSPGLEPTMLDAVINRRVRLAYVSLIFGITELCNRMYGKTIPILVHGYDYAVPDGRGFLGGWGPLPGPWLQPSLKLKGFENLARGKEIIRELIDAINAMLSTLPTQVAASAGGGAVPQVHYLDLRNTLANDQDYRDDWGNELHPTGDGFSKVAAKFNAAITHL